MTCDDLTQFIKKVFDSRDLIEHPERDIEGVQDIIRETDEVYDKLEQVYRWKGRFIEYYSVPADISEFEEIIKHPEQHEPFDVSPDGTKIAIIDGRTVRVIDTQTGEEICQTSKEALRENYLMRCFFISPDVVRVHYAMKSSLSSQDIVFDYFYLHVTSGRSSGAPFTECYEFPIEDKGMNFGVEDKKTIKSYKANEKIEVPRIKEISKIKTSSSGKYLIAECGESSPFGVIPLLAVLAADPLELKELTRDSTYAIGHQSDLLATILKIHTASKISVMLIGGKASQSISLEFVDDKTEVGLIAFDYDDKNVLVSDNKDIVHVLNIESGKEVASFEVGLGPVEWMQATSDNKLIVGCGTKDSWQIKVYKKREQ